MDKNNTEFGLLYTSLLNIRNSTFSDSVTDHVKGKINESISKYELVLAVPPVR